MASTLYPKGRNRFALGEIVWKASGGSTIRCCLVKTAYTYNSGHEYFSDLGANVVGNTGLATRASCPALTLIDAALSVCDAADAEILSVPVEVGACDYIAIFKDSGADGTSPLIALINTGTGLPITPDGNNVAITWDSGANKIFKL